MYEVVYVRSGRVKSRHKTFAAASQAIDRHERKAARSANKPGMMGGGYHRVELAVRMPPK